MWNTIVAKSHQDKGGWWVSYWAGHKIKVAGGFVVGWGHKHLIKFSYFSTLYKDRGLDLPNPTQYSYISKREDPDATKVDSA